MKHKEKILFKFLKMKGLNCFMFIIISFFQNFSLISQIGINLSNTPPAANAMLDVSSTSKGVLLPRMTTSQRNAISFPTAGLMIYNNTDNKYNYFNGGVWSEFVVGGFTLPFFASTDVPNYAFYIANNSVNPYSSSITSSSQYGTGIIGHSEVNTGVKGQSYGGIGVEGATLDNTSPSAVGVQGKNYSRNGIALKAINYDDYGRGIALEIENGPVKVSGLNRFVFVHTATIDNKISPNGTDIYNIYCNNDPNALLFVTYKFNPMQPSYNNSPIGLNYNTIRKKWEILNQNGTPIPTNAQFNVMVIKQ